MSQYLDDVFSHLLSNILNKIYNDVPITNNDADNLVLKQNQLKLMLFGFYTTLNKKSMLAYEIELLNIVVLMITILYLIRKIDNAKND